MKDFGEIRFTDGWLFALGDDPAAMDPGFDDVFFTPVSLPHDWQIEHFMDERLKLEGSQGYYGRNQIGWYRKKFTPPKEWLGKNVKLKLEGCQHFYDIYVNGKRVGGHRYGYVPYIVDITDELDYGKENTLAIRVNNRDNTGDRWYSGAGLYRPVSLIVNDPVHVAPWGIWVKYDLCGDSADVTIETEIENTSGRPRAAAALITLCGRECREAFTAEPGISRRVFRMKTGPVERWDVDDPKRYTLKLLLEGEGFRHEAEETIGFRTFAFDGDKGFFLNGKNRKLYGADLHHDAGAVFGAAVPRSVMRRRLEKLKAMGLNAIRFSHNPHDEYMYELCDEMGLLMIDEIYDKWSGSSLYFQELHEEDWRDDLNVMLRRDRNHPGIVLWSMGNEVEVQHSEFFLKRFAEMKAYTRSMDDTRPVTEVLCGFCGEWEFKTLDEKVDALLRYAEIADVFCGNYMENFYTIMRERGMNKPVIGTEVFSYYRHGELSATEVMAQSPWRDVDERDYVAGGFVWAGIDYLGESIVYKGKGWPGCPIDSTGIWKLRAWHLYSQWSKDDVLKLGVYDAEHVAWDGSVAMWGFPPLSGNWNCRQNNRILHVAAMTNCDEVVLYQNNEPPRRAKPDTPDRMAHFYVRYAEGTLRAEGLKDGKTVVQQVLHTSSGPCRLEAVPCDIRRGEDDIAAVEVYLKDEYGQIWEPGTNAVRFRVFGRAELVGVDNGDLQSENDPHSDRIPLNAGHAVCYVKMNGDIARVEVQTEGIPAASVTIRRR